MNQITKLTATCLRVRDKHGEPFLFIREQNAMNMIRNAFLVGCVCSGVGLWMLSAIIPDQPQIIMTESGERL